MIYRIDFQHFLTHAIDHFTRDELTHFQYAIISAKIKNGGRVSNMAKISELFPDPEIVINYSEFKDKKILESMFMDMLHPSKKDNGDNYEWISGIFYKTFINPLKHHQDIVIICDEVENDYIDVLCKCLKKYYAIEVIDLNELFSKGRVGPIYIDRDEIHNKAVDIARAASKEMIRTMSMTRDGRLKLISKMSKKDKIEKLEELGIKVTAADKDNLDKLLIEEWADNDEED